MNQVAALIEGNFESSCGLTPQFKAFARLFKRLFTKELAKKECELVKFSRGHFYVSGFFKNGSRLYYFSVSDVRDNWGTPKMLYRTATSTKDYTGGHNQYADIKDNMVFNMNF